MINFWSTIAFCLQTYPWKKITIDLLNWPDRLTVKHCPLWRANSCQHRPLQFPPSIELLQLVHRLMKVNLRGKSLPFSHPSEMKSQLSFWLSWWNLLKQQSFPFYWRLDKTSFIGLGLWHLPHSWKRLLLREWSFTFNSTVQLFSFFTFFYSFLMKNFMWSNTLTVFWLHFWFCFEIWNRIWCHILSSREHTESSMLRKFKIFSD